MDDSIYYSQVYDKEGDQLCIGEKVSFFDMVGEVTFECGAFGIAVEPVIDWKRIELEVRLNSNNAPFFCYNDNFISFWELAWNFNCYEDNVLYMVKTIY